MIVKSIPGAHFPGNSEKPSQASPVSPSAATNFVDALGQAVNEAEGQIKTADAKIADLVTGKNKDLHGTMIAMEKAEISTRLLLSVRNKMVSAYQEVMRMQI